jgi:hypothetical protein
MAQSKLSDLAGRFGKSPKGVGTGLKILAAAGAAAYGVSQSMYTGKSSLYHDEINTYRCHFVYVSVREMYSLRTTVWGRRGYP